MKKLALNTKKVCLLVLSVMLAVCSIFFVASLSNKSVSADETGFYMTTGAQVRLATDENDDSGIRFQAELSKAKFEEISALSENAIYFGMEIYPAGKPELAKDFCELVDSLAKETESEKSEVYFGEQETFRYVAGITYDMAQLKADLTNSPAHNENYVPGAEEQVEISEEAFTAYLNKAYGTELTARAYYMVDDEKTYVANPQTRSMWGVASEAYMADDSVWDGDVFLLDKYFSEITTADSRLNVLPNGKIVNSATIAETDKLYVSAQAVAVEDGIVDADVVNALDYGVDYTSYIVDANGNVSIQTLNKVHNVYQDDTLENGVLADFNEEGYADSVFLTSTGSYSVITGDAVDAEDVGANSGFLKFQPASYDGVIVQFKETFKLSDISQLYFKIRIDKELGEKELFRIRLYSSDMDRMGDLISFVPTVVGEWQTIILNPSQFTNVDQDASIGGIKFTFTAARTVYLDNIGWISGTWVDSALETEENKNVIATFDKEEYIFNASVSAGSTQILLGDAANEVASPSETGIVYAYIYQWQYSYVKTCKPFNLADIDSINLTIRYNRDWSKLRFGLRDAEGNNLINGGNRVLTDLMNTATLTEDAWYNISIPAQMLEKYFVGAEGTEIAELVFYQNTVENAAIYIDEISITPRVENLIADFNNVFHTKHISGSTPTILTGDAAVEAGSPSGTGVVKASVANYGYIYVQPRENLKLSDIVSINVTFKFDFTVNAVTNLIFGLVDADGNEVLNKYLYQLLSTSAQGLLVNGGWNTISIPAATLETLFSSGYSSDAPISKVFFKNNRGATYDIYIDEITITPYDSDVVADFNTPSFIGNLSSSGSTVSMAVLSGDAAIEAGSPSETGILQAGINNYGRLYIAPRKALTLSELYSINVTFKFTGPDVSKLRFGLVDADGNDMIAGGSRVLSDFISTDGLVNGEWNTISIPASKLISLLDVLKPGDEGAVSGEDEYVATVDTEVASVFFYNNIGSTQTLYIDEITLDFKFIDTTLADGVVADFDEDGYSQLVSFDEGSELVEFANDEGRGVLVATSTTVAGQIYVNLPDGKEFTISELEEGITIILKRTGYTSLESTRLYLYKEDGTYLGINSEEGYTTFANLGTGTDASTYVTLTVSVDELKVHFTEHDVNVFKLGFYPGVETNMTWYIDQISVK